MKGQRDFERIRSFCRFLEREGRQRAFEPSLVAQVRDDGIPACREHAALARKADGPMRHAETALHDLRIQTVGYLKDGWFVHMTVLPYNMAMVKPYDYGCRQPLWRITVRAMTDSAPFSDIAARIRWHRAIEGLNQSEYAEKAGIKRSQLSNWETGQQRVSVDGALSLRRTYGLSLDFIYEGIADALPMTLRTALRESPDVNASR